MLTRREWLLTTSAGVAAARLARGQGPPPTTWRRPNMIMTVNGVVPAAELGMALPHEHVLVDFIGADKASPERYDADEVIEAVLPHLRRAGELGCSALFECTPAYLGRDPALLRRLAEASGVQFVTNTGYYGAGENNKFLPPHALTEAADALAARWVAEFERGIGDTGVRPGFIKIGVSAGPLSDVHRKLVVAAARTHLKTGLTIAAHTGDGRAAIEQVDVLRAEGLSPAAFVWVHAQNERDPSTHARLADAGAWLSFDGVSDESLRRHLDLVRAAKDRGQLDRVLISHDAGWYRPGEPGGGTFRPFDTLFTKFLPALRDSGFTAEDVRQLTVNNPARAFTVRVRGG